MSENNKAPMNLPVNIWSEIAKRSITVLILIGINYAFWQDNSSYRDAQSEQLRSQEERLLRMEGQVIDCLNSKNDQLVELLDDQREQLDQKSN